MERLRSALGAVAAGVPDALFLLLLLLLGGCGDLSARTDLRSLEVRNSTYFAAGASEPFTGRVYRPFPGDSTRHEIEGTLASGTWDGELVVYHPSGRVRYMGSFDHGQRCGPWTENQADREPDDLMDQLRSDIESMGLYPPCPTDR